jgi:hypothetical protein
MVLLPGLWLLESGHPFRPVADRFTFGQFRGKVAFLLGKYPLELSHDPEFILRIFIGISWGLFVFLLDGLRAFERTLRGGLRRRGFHLNVFITILRGFYFLFVYLCWDHVQLERG